MLHTLCVLQLVCFLVFFEGLTKNVYFNDSELLFYAHGRMLRGKREKSSTSITKDIGRVQNVVAATLGFIESESCAILLL